jgi:DNA-binding NtrC family response regulator
MTHPIRILVVDDEPHVRSSLAIWLREDGYEVSVADSGKQALEIAAREPPDMLLVDIKMPGMDGLELQRRIRAFLPDATVVLMTAYAAVDTAVQALKDGAYDYIVKPFEPDDVSRLVRKAAERYTLVNENRSLRERLEASIPQIVAAPSGPMARVIEQADQVAPTDTNVLISGESGTGKELLARRIHARSQRAFGPLVLVSCGALTQGELESELFGHATGAYAGATTRTRGKLELAHEGTLFLDEVLDVPSKIQAELLRALEERKVTRAGGNAAVSTDFRLIAATNRVLEEELAAGPHRDELFFRIQVFRIDLPPLRSRPDDVPLLAQSFLVKYAAQMNRRIDGIAPEAMATLCSHPWPGNVRELKNAVERAVVVCKGNTLLPEHFPLVARPPAQDLTLSHIEEVHVRRVLAMFGFDVNRAAAELGIDPNTLDNQMKKYGIRRP